MAKIPQLVIDIGYQSIKVAQVRSTKNGVEVVKAGSEPLMLPPNSDQDVINQRIEETLPILLQRLGIKENRAIITLPGRAAFTRRLQVPVVRGRQLDRIIKYEAKQHIPFPLEQVNLDYQVSSVGTESTELDIHLVAVRKEIAEAQVKILKKCGIRADIIETAPLSIYNAYAASTLRDPDEVTAIVSIGASSTDIVIEQKSQMQFMRSAPVAGNALTSLIAKKFDIAHEEAETLKSKSAEDYDKNSSPSAEDVAAVLEKGFETIVTEIRRSFDFYVSQPDAEPVTRVVVCGGTTKMDGVCDFLEDRLGVPVTHFDFTGMDTVGIAPDLVDFVSQEVSLVGMCVRSANKSDCALSFAPEQIKQKLDFERRSPLLAVMALLLILIVGGSVYFIKSMVDRQTEAARRMKTTIEPTSDQYPLLTEARERQQKYVNRFDKINQVAEKRGRPLQVFLEIQRLIPSDVYIKKIEQFSGDLTIEGNALNEEKIYNYIQTLSMSPFFDNDAVALSEIGFNPENIGSQPDLLFTIKINKFNNPTDEEIQFVNEFSRLTKDIPILLVRFDPLVAGDDNSDKILVIGTYESESEKDRVKLLTSISTALRLSKDENIKQVEIRSHDRDNNELERIQVESEKIFAFRDGTLGEDEFVASYVQMTPSPSPVPTATPTPEGGAGAGMYGGMYGSMAAIDG
jgi:type IV pilus assembly protein PilM